MSQRALDNPEICGHILPEIGGKEASLSKGKFTEDLKRDAVRQITERGYPDAEASQRLGAKPVLLCESKTKFAASNAKGVHEAKEIRLTKELDCVIASGPLPSTLHHGCALRPATKSLAARCFPPAPVDLPAERQHCFD